MEQVSKCAMCGDPVEKKRGHKMPKFCSFKCRGASQRKWRIGDMIGDREIVGERTRSDPGQGRSVIVRCKRGHDACGGYDFFVRTKDAQCKRCRFEDAANVPKCARAGCDKMVNGRLGNGAKYCSTACFWLSSRASKACTIDGVVFSVEEIAEATNVDKQTIYDRIRNGLCGAELLWPTQKRKAAQRARRTPKRRWNVGEMLGARLIIGQSPNKKRAQRNDGLGAVGGRPIVQCLVSECGKTATSSYSQLKRSGCQSCIGRQRVRGWHKAALAAKQQTKKAS